MRFSNVASLGEPTALAAGVDGTTVAAAGPEASAYGSERRPEASADGSERRPEASAYGSERRPEASAYGSNDRNDSSAHRSPVLSDFTNTAYRLATVAMFLSLVGCSTFKPDWMGMGDPEPVIPESVLPIWSDTVLHQPGKPGVRGFGGRVYFYADEGGDPVKVDGSLTVYVFDADQHDTSSSKPLRKFVITADQLAGHHSKSDLGDSYSVWIPWDKVGGPSKSLSLIARFDGRNGGTAISDASSKLLPGSTDQDTVTIEKSTSQVQQVGFEKDESNEGDQPAAKGFKSYSLPLPPSFQRHMVGPRADLPAAAATDQSNSKWTTEEPAKVGSADSVESEADSGPTKYPVRRTPMSQRVFAPRPSEQARAKWQSGLPPTPRSPR